VCYVGAKKQKEVREMMRRKRGKEGQEEEEEVQVGWCVFVWVGGCVGM
jgi:hypothetical protein